MAFGNGVVAALLRSPLHRMLSGSTCVVRYRGRRSGRTIATPTQYARSGEGLVILVANHEVKQWWRNFENEHDLDVLLERRWVPMRGRALHGATNAEEVGHLLEAYLARFPKVEAKLPGTSRTERVDGAVVVQCRPR